MTEFSSAIIGNGSLLIQCGEILLERGHSIAAIVTDNSDIARWAEERGLRTEKPGTDIAARLADCEFDWLFSIANLTLLPDDLIRCAKNGAINFHDGPLPRYAGLNAPVWALLADEAQHGVTWHMIEGGIDEGDIVSQRMFDISDNETALTLNTKAYENAIASFAPLVDDLAGSGPKRIKQDLSQRSYCARDDRPANAGHLDFTANAVDISRLVRALDHGDYWNPLTIAKIRSGNEVFLVGTALPVAADAATPGTVLDVTDEALVVAAADGAVALSRLGDQSGALIAPRQIAAKGDVLEMPDADAAATLTRAMASAARADAPMRRHLAEFTPAALPLANVPGDRPDYRTRKLPSLAGFDAEQAAGIIAAWLARMGDDDRIDLAFRAADQIPDIARPYLFDWSPLRFDADAESTASAMQSLATDMAKMRKAGPWARDLIARDPALAMPVMPDIGLTEGKDATPIKGTCLSIHLAGPETLLQYDASRLSDSDLDLLLARLDLVVTALEGDAANQPLASLPILPEAERELVLHGWNATGAEYDRGTCIHQMFADQAARLRDDTALVFEAETLSYGELNALANQAASVLVGMGVTPGTPVGLYTPRSLEMMVGALAILKAGGAYVPLDPAYPEDRIAHYIADSGLKTIVTVSGIAADLPDHDANLLELDRDPRLPGAAETDFDSGVTASDLAYLIYTSGSTGTPKGVMVEHRNVANFFAGMDQKIDHEKGGVWMAVTSLSFDISVLELFYTLARGFKVVLAGDDMAANLSSGRVVGSGGEMDFSLYFWGNDDGPGPKKYELLLEGAKFADKHGFTAIYTPERHFHAFGGPYPNPSVTGAAVAAVTQNLSVRAGSCVTPLHHTARVAEEWAVIDNLTNGRAGLAVASGWQPDDFVLMPKNSPPDNRQAMFDAIEDLRRLWRGEAVEFPKQDGSMHSVLTQPRPVSRDLPIWVTIAGNPDTWREAGEIGAHVLTHLLGQSIDEVEGKIEIYHEALRKAGHDPADFHVTLMLHTFVGRDREVVRATARTPMRNYMLSAAGLIKQCVWSFPAFKKPKGVTNPFDIDLATLSEDELEGILEYAFNRYFDDSGLFGTVEDCLRRVDQVRRIGVTEIACLIDYGIPAEVVLEGLYPLAEVLRQSSAPGDLAEDDFSLAAQILRHEVTHMQCTPSMARMISMDDGARAALQRIEHLMIGGEALPGALVADLGRATKAAVLNMYGPTETTIWSSTAPADKDAGIVSIGQPIANTAMYVLDANRQPVPIGSPGELYIGGDGVTRGYWQRPDMTAERFLADPFATNDPEAPARMYRTGDRVVRQSDGTLDFLGRTDQQVKLRGHRIEPGEIEACLQSLSEIAEAVVIAREDVPGDIRLVAYIRHASPMTEAAMRAALATSLPDYMMPAHFVALDALPLTPNGKVDRKALPAPKSAKILRIGDAADQPGGGVAAIIADIWSRILGVPNVGTSDNFFDLGGHSLLAVQSHREIREALNTTRVNITDIFRYPRLADLAAHLESVLGSPETAAPPREGGGLAEKARARSDAMARRRAMRASRRADSA